MIFITVGSEKFPFDRLIKIIDEAKAEQEISEPIFAQIGTSAYLPKHYEYSRFLTYKDMVDQVRKADLIISHAGIGSFLMCLQYDKVPILFPRQAELKEHLDDHQTEFVKGIIYENMYLWAENKQELLERINNYQAHLSRCKKRNTVLTNKSLCDYLDALVTS